MLTNPVFAGIISAGILGLGADVVSGQTTSTGSGQAYPNRPIRIVSSLPGGSANYKARIIGPGISGPLGQPVIVENRPSILLRQIISKALPDGYTLLIAGGAYWVEPLMRNDPQDPVRDISPIVLIDEAPNVLVVHPSVAANSVKELIALAKAKPGVLNYGSAQAGSSTHLAGELFKSLAGINIVRIPFAGTDQILTSLFSGEVQLVIGSAGSISPQLKSDKLRALAVTSARPSALFPGLPTIDASGLPGYEYVGIEAIFAPAKTPDAIINRLNQEIVRFLKMPEVKEKFLNAGVAVTGSSPKELADFVKADIARMGKLVKDAGIKAD